MKKKKGDEAPVEKRLIMYFLGGEKFMISNSETKNKIKLKRCQRYFLPNFYPPQEFIDNPEHWLENCQDVNVYKLLNYLIWCVAHGYTYISQNRMAAKLGLSIRHIQRYLNQLRAMGFVQWIYRDYDTCVYRISDYFKSMEIILKLTKFLPNLNWLWKANVVLFNRLQDYLKNTYSIFLDNHRSSKEYHYIDRFLREYSRIMNDDDRHLKKKDAEHAKSA